MPPHPCDSSGIFGEPATGAHAYRLGGLAAVDLLATAGAAVLLARGLFGRAGAGAVVQVFIILMLAGVVLHERYCVNTRLNAFIFGRPWPAPHPRKPPRRGGLLGAHQ